MKKLIIFLSLLLTTSVLRAEVPTSENVDKWDMVYCTTVAIANSSLLASSYNKLSSIKVGNSRSMWEVLKPSLQVGPRIDENGQISTSISGGIDLLAPFSTARWQKKTNNLAIKDAENDIATLKNKIAHDVEEAWNTHQLNLSKIKSLADMSRLLYTSLQSSKKDDNLTKAITIFLLRDSDIRIMDAKKDLIASRANLLRVMEVHEK